jgi:hypothetical protein
LISEKAAGFRSQRGLGHDPASVTLQHAVFASYKKARVHGGAAAVLNAAVKKVGRVQAMTDRIREELGRALPQKTMAKKAAADPRLGRHIRPFLGQPPPPPGHFHNMLVLLIYFGVTGASLTGGGPILETGFKTMACFG